MPVFDYGLYFHDLIKNHNTLNTPRYSLRKRRSSSIPLILLAIGKILYLGLVALLFGLLNLLLRLYNEGLRCRRFCSCALISSIWTLSKLIFFCLLRIITISVLEKPVGVAIVVRSHLLNSLKDFFHRRCRSRQLCMPIPAIRAIWTKSQLVPAVTKP